MGSLSCAENQWRDVKQNMHRIEKYKVLKSSHATSMSDKSEIKAED